MKIFARFFTLTFLSLTLLLPSAFLTAPAFAEDDIDVSYLQTCLKAENSTLDVLVLMDSSRSLREYDPKVDPPDWKNNDGASDPKKIRGPILKSSLKLLRTLAKESDRKFFISLRNFGENSNPKELKNLKANWVNWTDETSDDKLDDFVEKALYDDSHGTEWSKGLISARKEFSDRLGTAALFGGKSCQIMFWITDGAPTSIDSEKNNICNASNPASIEWFREKNILVVGGLLQPKAGTKSRNDAANFAPIVTGSDCGINRQSWTRGKVIEADTIDALAWGFVGVIANIKNLVNLDAKASKFTVDPGTSHIEIFIRRGQSNWEVKTPDGKVFCSINQKSDACRVNEDKEIGITTVTIFPENPSQAGGTWSVTNNSSDENLIVFGGISTTTDPGADRSIRLEVDPKSLNVEEGKEAKFKAKLVNPDGTTFTLDGYSSVQICANVKSSTESVCKSGSTATELGVFPNESDKDVSFEATLTSAQYGERKYRITANATINVTRSGQFPSLLCEKDPCWLHDIKNKNDNEAISKLMVRPAESGATGGQIKIVGRPEILSDQVKERGDGKFNFEFTRASGEPVDANTLFEAGDNLTLQVTTNHGGKGLVQGVIKYEVLKDGQTISRQLNFKFNVKDEINWPVLIVLMLLAYLLTIGLPYLYLLWSARRAAVLSVPDEEFSHLVVPVIIKQNGKVISAGGSSESLESQSLEIPNHENLSKQEVPSGTKSIEVRAAMIEVIPPRWWPFEPPVTRVSIPNSHILTTHGESSFSANEASFSSSLVNEAIIYFSTEEHLAPTTQSQIVSDVAENKNELFSSTYESKISEELNKRTGDISGNAIFMIPRFGNRRKSLEELTKKLISTCDSANLSESIAELRVKAFEDEVARVEAAKKVAELENLAKKSEVKDLKNVENDKDGNVEVDEVKKQNIWSEDDEDSPDAGTGRKLWE